MVLVRKINRKSMKIVQKCELVKTKISARKKNFFRKNTFFGSCPHHPLPRFKFWRQSEKIWPLSAQHRYVKELVQNVPGVFEPWRIQSYHNVKLYLLTSPILWKVYQRETILILELFTECKFTHASFR